MMKTDESGVKFDTVDIPKDYIEQAVEYREASSKQFLILMMILPQKYLEGEELSIDEIKLGIRKATFSLNLLALFREVHSRTKVCRC